MKKTISFAIMHFIVAFSVAWALTGDVIIGGTVALVEPAVNTIAYYWHERFWMWRKLRTADGNGLGTPAYRSMKICC